MKTDKSFAALVAYHLTNKIIFISEYLHETH